MKFLSAILRKLPEYRKIINLLNSERFCFGVTGLSLINKIHLFYGILKEDKKNNKSASKIFIVPNESLATDLQTVLLSFNIKCAIYPAKDYVFYNIAGKSNQYEYSRLNVLNKIIKNEIDVAIVPVKSVLQKTMPKEVFLKSTLNIKTGDTINTDTLKENLLHLGYKMKSSVDDVGNFSVRGSIIDIYPVNFKNPVRLDFWGESLESISFFDVETQKKINRSEEIEIIPCNEIILKEEDYKKLSQNLEKTIEKLKNKKANADGIFKLLEEKDLINSGTTPNNLDKFLNLVYSGGGSTLLDYIKEENSVFIFEVGQIEETLKNLRAEFKEFFNGLKNNGTLFEELGEFYKNRSYLIKSLESLNTVYLDAFVHNNYFTDVKEKINISAKQIPVWDGRISNLIKDIEQNKTENSTIIILAGTDENAYRVSIELQKEGIKDVQFKREDLEYLENKVYVLPGTLPYGFKYLDANVLLITYKNKSVKKEISTSYLKQKKHSLNSLTDLSVGDYVVHVLHGIGIFRGITNIEIGKVVKDYIKIEYAGSDIVYVPVTQMDLIDKYVGIKEGAAVALNKLGTTDWKKSKARAKAATKDIAKELTKLYAQRMEAKGFAFHEDDELQKDFESQFEYEETEDQKQCILEIKEDMQSIKPMDRLLCGDVGFGKTEVAMRAIFKCVSQGKQCAVLVPTTILAWQHYQNMVKRFEKFPIKIELLSRFRTPREQKNIIEELKKGKIDIIIGTHRLVQKDVSYNDLGLVVIDEEQRFGVSQKEKFKNIVKNVDILTLSATPIPRTLHMAMSGIRDMSVIRQAPQNRFPTQTYVLEHDQNVILEAIRAEIKRDGQVYYLHNDVSTIEKLAIDLQNALPEARIAYAHGKMAETELSNIWQRMVEHNIDVLVCTTIIETGVDVPNVNTLIIDRADYMGLSQLHQIRGRVGRSNRKAYAYFTFSKNKVLSETAHKRLEVIRDLTEFGSGFKIAKRDLELRGAGNLLSSKQSGHIADVGYDMYLRLLKESIDEEKGKIDASSPEDTGESTCAVELEVQIHIPKEYIPDDSLRIDVYKEVSSVKNEKERIEVLNSLNDRFGSVPKDIIILLDTVKVKNLAAKMSIEEIRQVGSKIIFFGNNISEKFCVNILKNFPKSAQFSSSGKMPSLAVSLQSKENVIHDLINILESA